MHVLAQKLSIEHGTYRTRGRQQGSLTFSHRSRSQERNLEPVSSLTL